MKDSSATATSERLARLLVSPTHTLRETMTVIDKGAKGIAFVVDPQGRLLATLTDGDVRRGILAGVDLDEPVERLLERKANSPYAAPLSAAVGTDAAELLALMRRRSIRHVPLVDAVGRIVDFRTLDQLTSEPGPPIQAVIMAGGLGSRLGSLTADTPKPMLPVADRPLIERTVERLREAGVRRLNIATHYLPEKIIDHFGDGSKFGVAIDYVRESEPLGTAGALKLLRASDEPILVVNGDVLTRVDYRALHAFHREQKADMTVGVRAYKIQVPYGVVECRGPEIVGLTEKPEIKLFVNAGVYLLEPTVLALLPEQPRFDMTELIDRLLQAGKSVVSFPIVEYWIDVGRTADYQQADVDLRSGGGSS